MEDDNESVQTQADAKPEAVNKDSEKLPAAKKKQRQFRVKKPKDMPRRPLSAYNIFFREERANLLEERRLGRARGDDASLGFEKMARTIGQRWKELAAGELDRFKALAKHDTERYRKEMECYHQGLAVKSRREREESSQNLEGAGHELRELPPTPVNDLHQSSAIRILGPCAAASYAARLEERQRGSRLSASHQQLGLAGSFPHHLSAIDRVHSLTPAAATITFQSPTSLPRLSFQDAMLLNYMQQQQSSMQAASLQDDLISATIRRNLLARARADQANNKFLASLHPIIQQRLLLAQVPGSNLLSAGSLAALQSRRGHLPASYMDPPRDL